jgi:hypothetical protein
LALLSAIAATFAATTITATAFASALLVPISNFFSGH